MLTKNNILGSFARGSKRPRLWRCWEDMKITIIEAERTDILNAVAMYVVFILWLGRIPAPSGKVCRSGRISGKKNQIRPN